MFTRSSLRNASGSRSGSEDTCAIPGVRDDEIDAAPSLYDVPEAFSTDAASVTSSGTAKTLSP